MIADLCKHAMLGLFWMKMQSLLESYHHIMHVCTASVAWKIKLKVCGYFKPNTQNIKATFNTSVHCISLAYWYIPAAMQRHGMHVCVRGGYDASQCMWMKVKIILINVAFSIKIGISETILCLYQSLELGSCSYSSSHDTVHARLPWVTMNLFGIE